jgi:chaperonin GroES
MIVKKGDTVVIPDYGGTPIQLDQEEFLLFQNKDLLGILDQ